MKYLRLEIIPWIMALLGPFLFQPLAGQCDENQVINPGFETVGPPCGPVPPDGLINGSFNQGCMTGWEAAWGTPSVCAFGPNEGDYFACLGANNEGFFQTLLLSADSTYCLSFYFRRLNSGSGSLDVYLAGGLVNQSMGNSGYPPITVLPSWQLLGSFPATSNEWTKIFIPSFMQLDPANTQLLFLDVPTGGLDVGIDDVKLSIPGNPDPNIVVDIVCADQSGSTFTFEGSLNPLPPGFENAEWEWSFGDGQSGNGQVVTHTYSTYGEYEVCLSVVVDCGCEGFGCITFSYDPCICSCTVDMDPPQFINFNPGPIFVFDLEDIPDPQEPEITDCDPAAFLVLEESESGPPCNRTINYRWIASDLCGNTSEMTQIVIFEDTSPPEFIIPPGNLTSSCPDYMSDFLLWINDFGGATVSDESGVFDLSVDYDSTFPNSCGEILVDFIATDICGFQNTMVAIFTYTDTEAPELLVFPQNLVFPCTGIEPDDLEQWLEGNAGASVVDACGDVTWSNDFSGSTNEDTVQVFFEAEDQCSNTLTISAFIIQTAEIENVVNTIYTCDILAAGIDTVLEVNQSCSLYVITHLIYIPVDQVFDSTYVCDTFLAGIDTTIYLNRFGCDSLVITASLLAPSDTFRIDDYTCDPLLAGVDTTYFSNRFGCDSLVITATLLAPSDTFRTEAYTCDPLIAGTDTTYFINNFGCDSLRIHTSLLSYNDTTRMETLTCDPAGVSADTLYLTGTQGCDSVVINTVLFAGGPFIIEDEIVFCGPGVNFSDTIQVQGDPCDTVLITHYLFVPSDTTIIITRVCNPNDTGTVTIVLENINGCDSTILTNGIYFPPDSVTYIEYQCFGPDTMGEGLLYIDQFGCDSLFATFYLINATPDTQFVQRTTCDTSMGGLATEIIPGLYCDTVRIIETVWVPVLITRDTQLVCVPPLIVSDTFYFVSSQGCDSLLIRLIEDNGPQMNILTTHETCQGFSDGSILVETIDGGVLPYLFSLNGGSFDTISIWDLLPPGDYDLVVQDAALCRDTLTAIRIDTGFDLMIEAGPDVEVSQGDIVPIQIDSVGDWPSLLWQASDPVACPVCPLTFLGPVTQEQFVHIMVTNSVGCSAIDSFNVFLRKDDTYFIPNIFSPNLDGINDYFFLSGSASIVSSYDMIIFDRWGNQVFQAVDIATNDPSSGWNGQYQGQLLNPGVFIYLIEVASDGGSPEFITGNVSLVR